MTEEMEYLKTLQIINHASAKWVGKHKTAQGYFVDIVAMSTEEMRVDDSPLIHIFHNQHEHWTQDEEYTVMLQIDRGELTQMLNYQALLRNKSL